MAPIAKEPQTAVLPPVKQYRPGTKAVVSHEQFNNGCNPAEPKGGMCPQAMTSWWVVRRGHSGAILYAAKDEADARTWASQWEAQAGPNGDTANLMPEPTAIDMPAPGTDVNAGVTDSGSDKILGMNKGTALLAGGAVLAAFLLLRN